MAQRLEAVLARELRPMPAGDDHLDPVGGELPRGRDERREVLARGLRRDAEDVGAGEAERAARGLRVGVRGEGGVDAARDDADARGRQLQQVREFMAGELGYGHDVQRATGQGREDAPLPGRVGRRVPLGMAQRRGVVDHDDVARERQRGEVGGAQERARAGRPQRQHELLPGVAGAVHEPRRRREDLVRVGPQRGQAGGELARPAFDAAEGSGRAAARASMAMR